MKKNLTNSGRTVKTSYYLHTGTSKEQVQFVGVKEVLETCNEGVKERKNERCPVQSKVVKKKHFMTFL